MAFHSAVTCAERRCTAETCPHADLLRAGWGVFRKVAPTYARRLLSAADLPPGKTDSVRPCVSIDHCDDAGHHDGEGFVVLTSEGTMHAPWGSWLAFDSRGNLYAIAAEEFENIYEQVGGGAPG